MTIIFITSYRKHLFEFSNVFVITMHKSDDETFSNINLKYFQSFKIPCMKSLSLQIDSNFSSFNSLKADCVLFNVLLWVYIFLFR